MQMQPPSGPLLPLPNRHRGNSINFHKQNINQIREAQQLNRERIKQLDSKEEKAREQRAALQAKLLPGNIKALVNTHGPEVRRTQKTGGAPRDDNATIEVFVNECDPARRHQFSYDEGLEQAGGLEGGSPSAGPRSVGLLGKGGPLTSRNLATLDAAALRPPRNPKTAPLPALPAKATHQHQAGAVPQYLLKRKEELQGIKDEIARVAYEQAERAKYPPGRRPLSDAEQSAVLQALSEKKVNLEVRLSKIPMRFDNPSVQRRRKETEDEIAQVESDIRKYSRKGVLVSTEGY